MFTNENQIYATGLAFSKYLTTQFSLGQLSILASFLQYVGVCLVVHIQTAARQAGIETQTQGSLMGGSSLVTTEEDTSII